MFSNKIQLRIRYGETDQMGIVYHGNYAQFLEMGRIEWLRNLGLSYKKMEEEGVKLPVISLTVNFRKPAYFDQLIYVTTSLRNTPGVKIVFDYKIQDENGELLSEAETTLAFINMKNEKPMRCPEAILRKLQAKDLK